MAIRPDVSIDWSVSPRLLTVASPSTEITVQEIVDTCRFLEDSEEGNNFDYLIDAAGKEPLGGIVSVGITATLNNAYIAFEARSGPSWVLCIISGGNIVAIDDVGAELDPRFPTAFVSVDRTASSSATLLEQMAVQHSSFNEGVTIDVINGVSGLDFPIGTGHMPVNNLTQAKTIATLHGFHHLFIIGDFTAIATDDISDFTLIGQSAEKSTITIENGCITNNSEFEFCHLQGTLNGGSVAVRTSHLLTINNFTGIARECCLDETVSLSAGFSHFFHCVSGVPGAGTPVIDMGGSGRSLGVRAYAGGIAIRNFTGAADNISLDFISGQAKIESTCTNGYIVVRGTAKITDDSTGSITVDITNLVNPITVADENWGTDLSTHQDPDSTGEAMDKIDKNTTLIPGTL